MDIIQLIINIKWNIMLLFMQNKITLSVNRRKEKKIRAVMEIIYFMLNKNNNGLKTENKYHNRSEEGQRWYHLW